MQALQTDFDLMPQSSSTDISHMQQHNWLYPLQYKEGIEKKLYGLARFGSIFNREFAIAFSILMSSMMPRKFVINEFFPSLSNLPFIHLTN
jgi:hypothetical protein